MVSQALVQSRARFEAIHDPAVADKADLPAYALVHLMVLNSMRSLDLRFDRGQGIRVTTRNFR